MLKTTILFGGAFNPPTIAHHQILQTITNHANTLNADVWVIPSGNRTDKTITTPTEKRLQYVEAMIEEIINPNPQTQLKIIDIELHRGYDVETYDSHEELTQEYCDKNFVWVFGADSTQTILSWKNGQWLADNLNIIALHRPHTTIASNIKNLTTLPMPSIPVSSTMVREHIKNKQDYRELVTPKVYNLLQK